MLLTGVHYVSWDFEELHRGTIAKELIEGLKVPLWDYQTAHYDGGSFWAGVLAVPFFLLFGPNLFALKLVGLLFSLATLILTFFFFKKFFDQKTALLVSALLVFPPPVFTALSLTANSSHPQSIFFTSAMLFFFYQFLYGEKNKRLFLILFGLVAGLGFWFTSITFITTLTCLISWVLIDRCSFLSKKLFIFLGSFLVGASPWILYEFTQELRGLVFLKDAFLWRDGTFIPSFETKLGALPGRIFTLVFRTFPFVFWFRSFLNIPNWLFSLFYGFAATLLVIPFFWREIRRLSPLVKNSFRYGKLTLPQLNGTKTLPFLIYPFSFILLYSISNIPTSLSHFPFDFPNFRYFSPIYYFSFCLFSLSVCSKKSSVFLLSVLLGLGLIGQGSLLFQESVGRALHYQGYTYIGLGEIWGRYLYPFPYRLKEFSLLADRFREQERRYLYWGLANDLFLITEVLPSSFFKIEDPERVVRSIRRAPPSYRVYFFEKWGRSLGIRLLMERQQPALSASIERDFGQYAMFGKFIPKEDRTYFNMFYYGLAAETPWNFFGQTMDALRSIRMLNISDPTPLYFGFGQSFYRSHFEQGKKWTKGNIEILNSLGKEEKTWTYRGMGAEAAGWWLYATSNDSFTFAEAFNSIGTKASSGEGHQFSWGIGWGLRMASVEDRTRALDWLHWLPDEIQLWAREGFLAAEKWYGVSPNE